MPIAPRFRLTAAATATALAALPASAPAAETGWLDLISPDRLVTQLLQTGILMARTQVDLQYSDLTVNALSGTATMTDISIWPLPDWDENGDCVIEIERLTLQGTPLDDPSTMKLRLQVTGGGVDPTCLPPDAAPIVQMTGQDWFDLPRLTLDVSYDVPSAGADLHLYADVSGVAAVDLSAEFTYLWFDGRGDMDNPDPVIFLSHAALTVENGGLWDLLRNFTPPPLSDPASAPGMIDAILRDGLGQMNAEAAPEGQSPAALNAAQLAFIESAKTAWTGFLENPQRLVLETGLDKDEDVFLDVIYYEDDPTALFDDLRPRLATAPATIRSVLPVALVQRAIGQGDGLSPGDRLTVGTALLTGDGAPRNTALGLDLLTPLAEGGDGDAALELARALEDTAPGDAYRWALVAGAADTYGAAALLDRLEGTLSFADVLNLQIEVLNDAEHPIGALSSLATIRAQATQRLSGMGQSRAYGVAAMWAGIGAAAGDAECKVILDEIAARTRHAEEDGRALWQTVEADAQKLATEAWLNADLPTRLGAN